LLPTTTIVRALVVMFLVATLNACGDQWSDGPDAATEIPDASTDAADAGPDAVSPDAAIDTTPPPPDLDRDNDGTDDDDDCAADDPMRWHEITVWTDGDGDFVGSGEPGPACVGLAPPKGTALIGGDCDDAERTRFQLLAYAALDADGDLRYVAATGTVCSGQSLPVGYLHVLPPIEPDCDDGEADRYRVVTLFADNDDDHVGTGLALPTCIGATLPEHTADVDGDCNDDDRTTWRFLPYQHRDFDDDGVTTPKVGEVCSGATLPRGYRTTPIGADCDDENKTVWRTVDIYDDSDHDGVGAGPGTPTCIGQSAPPDKSLTDTDCAASDATLWRLLAYAHVDRDRDGATMPETGAECSGDALLPPFYTTAHGNDCNDDNDTLTRYVVLYPDGDGDGVGRTPSVIQCLGATLPEGFSTGGYDIDDGDPAVIEDEEEDDLVDLILM